MNEDLRTRAGIEDMDRLLAAVGCGQHFHPGDLPAGDGPPVSGSAEGAPGFPGLKTGGAAQKGS